MTAGLRPAIEDGAASLLVALIVHNWLRVLREVICCRVAEFALVASRIVASVCALLETLELFPPLVAFLRSSSATDLGLGTQPVA